MVHHCSSNPKMKCYFDCPLRDHEFSDLLDVWVLTDREPPSLNWERGGIIDNRAAERRVLKKCEVARLFDHPERLQWFIANGHMTRWLCSDLRRGYFLWRETRKGISLRRARSLWRKVGG